MPISPEHEGRSYPPTDPYEVTAAKVAEFATAVGDNPRGSSAPPTFAVVVAMRAWEGLFADQELELSLHRIVHGEQSFRWHRPLRVGDVVEGVLGIDKVRVRGLVEFVNLTVHLRTTTGEPLCDASSTLVHTREAA